MVSPTVPSASRQRRRYRVPLLPVTCSCVLGVIRRRHFHLCHSSDRRPEERQLRRDITCGLRRDRDARPVCVREAVAHCGMRTEPETDDGRTAG